MFKPHAIQTGLLAAALLVAGSLQGCGGAEAQPSPPAATGGSLQRMSYTAILGPAAGPYSHGVKANGLLYMSGLSAFASPAQGKGTAEQLAEILKQLTAVAQAENTDLGSLAKVTIFVTSLDDLAGIRAALEAAYKGKYPASSLIQVARLFDPSINVEVEAVFAIP